MNKSSPKTALIFDSDLIKKIKDTAKEHNIPLENNEELTRILARVNLPTDVPQELYSAVAQLIVFLYRFNEEEEL